MRAALGRALPAPRTTASDGSRIGICILIGSAEKRKGSLKTSKPRALVNDGAPAAQGLHLGYNRRNDREADL